MNPKHQAIALYTLVRRELVRMFRIASQVFLPPVITTALYFAIFGSLIGARIGPVAGFDYAHFIAPGLVMMMVITNAYANVSSSLFSVRFQRSIDEMLVSPMHYSLLLLGYTLGGVLRGLIVALLVYAVSGFFTGFELAHPMLSLLVVLLVAGLFSLAGFTNAMLARTFDDISIIPTFVLTPLTYLGGVFYATSMLSPFWEKLSHFNPILYMVNALRYAMLGSVIGGFEMALSVIVFSLLLMGVLNLWMLKRGIGLRE
ncbi:ABC transporter permease [Legionella geestiana]|uniref:Transport permease protein n=1 Tax=Legionella geestiana TaxID=45065 RepID=A0A0W0TV59_9GAMM|nr:ABC transporter permease [Legionella geestiana]KTC99304.1 ABC transporter permease [Legionella geestiana]QBS11982.1 ABC transporter permease [Legionella geestiana]QDQ40408.1 ABC transporter permease [Legionella geestiana]STX53304.1 ABC transporter permease [Legionella geestiana]